MIDSHVLANLELELFAEETLPSHLSEIAIKNMQQKTSIYLMYILMNEHD